MVTPRPMALIILDGFGHKETSQYNAIKQAHTPNLDHYFNTYTHTLISGSGHDVGLPHGQMGNSEVGHVNIGAGRLVSQDLTRIDNAIASNSFCQNDVIARALNDAKNSTANIHVMGLVSDGGVHSHINHILAMLSCAHQQGIGKERLFLHAFLDGRDTPPQSALPYLQQIEDQGFSTIASLMGRYYAMDRDNRWERVQLAYDLLTFDENSLSDNTQHSVEMSMILSRDVRTMDGKEVERMDARSRERSSTFLDALTTAYAQKETDEFVKPVSLLSSQAIIRDGDIVIFMNFRSDRARELTRAFMDPNFSEFQRKKVPVLKHFISLTEYQKEFNALNIEVAYPPTDLSNTLGEYLSHLGKTQLRIAETEKYAHVTFFFNGGIEPPFPGEDRILVPSPKVATYDLKPEMSAYELTEKLVDAIHAKKYDVIICNYANPDMVGHTGNLPATVKAIEAIDDCLGNVIAALQAVGGEALITADHGNAECMYDETTHQPHTAHTTELVPLLYIGRKAKIVKTDGVLSDIAPTLLSLIGLEPPKEMTGRVLMAIEKT